MVIGAHLVILLILLALLVAVLVVALVVVYKVVGGPERRRAAQAEARAAQAERDTDGLI